MSTIQKTFAERQQIKAAKKAWKENRDIPFTASHEELQNYPDAKLTGIFPGEEPLEDDHPVFAGYLYVIDDNGGKVIKSDVTGTVNRLRQDLQMYRGLDATVIRNCKIIDRKI